MNGQHHTQISVLTGLIITIPFLFTNSLLSIIFLFGLFMGSLLPDSDASDRKAKHGNLILFIFDTINEFLIYPFLRIIFHEHKKHRGILHTIVGVFVFSLIFSIVTGIILFLLNVQFYYAIFFGLGLFIGGLLHLIEDCCTVSGLNPFYPKYKQTHFKGNISTSNKKDIRPGIFSGFLIILFVLLIFSEIYYKIDQLGMIFYALIAMLLSWIVFLIGCGVRRSCQ